MHIQGPAHVHGPQPINAPHRAAAPQPASDTSRLAPVDQLDISREAELLSQAQESQPIRTELVESIRAQIAAGTYDTEEKLAIAVDRLFDEMG